MANKKKNKKQKNGFNIDFAVIGVILLGILLMVLVYSNAGIIGEFLSPFLGGLMGINKYILPIIVFVLGISLIFIDKKEMYKRIVQYMVLIFAISTVLYLTKSFSSEYELLGNFQRDIQNAYTWGADGTGGGVLGAIIGIPLINLFGKVGATIVIVGIGILCVVFISGFKFTEFVINIKEKINSEEKSNDKNDAKEKIIKEKPEKRKGLFKPKEEDSILEEQISINLHDNTKENVEISDNSIRPETKAKVDELFKTKEKEKTDNTEQKLMLEHTITVEEENYEFPPIELLSENKNISNKNSKKELLDTASKLQKTLASFGVDAKVVNVSKGPVITRYELQPSVGVKVSKIVSLTDDIALNLAAPSLRMEAPIPGKAAVGIEIPNKTTDMVYLRDIIESEKFGEFDSRLAFGLGKDITGENVIANIGKMPHVLIAGSTGSGKSVCINTLIASLVYKSKPSEVKLLMIDPKVVELSVYNGIPHLLIPVVTDPKKAAGALNWAVQEMVHRYSLFATKGVRDLKGYNQALVAEGAGKLPEIVIIIDELADLMMVAPNDVEDAICRLAQMARAAGMHLVIATQRPSVDVITGIIKANIPSRIAFAVSSQVDSRTILDMAGAEKLLGKGDMLFYPVGESKPVRLQGAFISDKEVEEIVSFIKSNGEVRYNEDIIESIEKSNTKQTETGEEDEEFDPLLADAIDMVVESGQASASYIQRRFKVGYARAGRIIDQMEARGIVSGYEGSKPRQVLISKESWQEMKMQATSQSDEQTDVTI